MSIKLSAGIRNVPVFMAEVRESLGFSREVMGRFVGLSAREVYWVEIGRVPDVSVIERIKLLLIISPTVLVLSDILLQVVTWVSTKRQWFVWSLKGIVDKTGQIRLPI